MGDFSHFYWFSQNGCSGPLSKTRSQPLKSGKSLKTWKNTKKWCPKSDREILLSVVLCAVLSKTVIFVFFLTFILGKSKGWDSHVLITRQDGSETRKSVKNNAFSGLNFTKITVFDCFPVLNHENHRFGMTVTSGLTETWFGNDDYFLVLDRVSKMTKFHDFQCFPEIH